MKKVLVIVLVSLFVVFANVSYAVTVLEADTVGEFVCATKVIGLENDIIIIFCVNDQIGKGFGITTTRSTNQPGMSITVCTSEDVEKGTTKHIPCLDLNKFLK